MAAPISQSSDQITSDVSQAVDTASQPTRRKKKSAAAFRTISAVAKILDVQQHVLRFWETKFSQVKPLKRGGGRRYYRPEDLELLKAIHHLLYTEGYTIKGVQKLLREQGRSRVVQNNTPSSDSDMSAQIRQKPEADSAEPLYTSSSTPSITSSQKHALQSVLSILKTLRLSMDTL